MSSCCVVDVVRPPQRSTATADSSRSPLSRPCFPPIIDLGRGATNGYSSCFRQQRHRARPECQDRIDTLLGCSGRLLFRRCMECTPPRLPHEAITFVEIPV
jgi:hypothetical protein